VILWMQTTGAALLVVRRCSLARVPMIAQDVSSAWVAVPCCCTARPGASNKTVNAALTSSLHHSRLR